MCKRGSLLLHELGHALAFDRLKHTNITAARALVALRKP
jgi:hypothetical protein